MKLWAVVEDYYDGKDEDLEYHEYYDNQLIGLFLLKTEAFNNLKAGVRNIWKEDSVQLFGKYIVTYSDEFGAKLCRRLVTVETGKMYPNVWSHSILNGERK